MSTKLKKYRQYAIAKAMLEHGYTDALCSAKRAELMDYVQCSKNTLYKDLQQMMQNKLVNEGPKDGRICTYYLTQAGIEAIE